MKSESQKIKQIIKEGLWQVSFLITSGGIALYFANCFYDKLTPVTIALYSISIIIFNVVFIVISSSYFKMN